MIDLSQQANVVIDTNLVVQAYTLYSKHRQHGSYPLQYQIIHAFKQGYFKCLWNENILGEYWETLRSDFYQEGRLKKEGLVDLKSYQKDERLIRFAGRHVSLSVEILAEARRLISSLGRPKKLRDLDDAIFLATAEEGNALYLVSEDRSIQTMGDKYGQSKIVVWWHMLEQIGYPVTR